MTNGPGGDAGGDSGMICGAERSALRGEHCSLV